MFFRNVSIIYLFVYPFLDAYILTLKIRNILLFERKEHRLKKSNTLPCDLVEYYIYLLHTSHIIVYFAYNLAF